MSLDTLVDSNYRSFSSSLAQMRQYTGAVIGALVPGVAISALSVLAFDGMFGIAEMLGCAPGPISAQNSLMYIMATTPIISQFFYHDQLRSNKKQVAPELYGPFLPHSQKLVYEIMHGSLQVDEAQTALAPVYAFPIQHQPPAA